MSNLSELSDMNVVVVTGGSNGIGWATCELFAERGWRVVIFDIAAPPEHYKQCWDMEFFECDVTDEFKLRTYFLHLFKKYGRLDCLVNNVGHYVAQHFEWTQLETLRSLQKINVESIFQTTKIALDFLKRSKIASIVNVACTSAIHGRAEAGSYSATKGAVLSFTKSLALDLAPYKIRVNSVSPSYVQETRSFEQWIHSLPTIEAREKKHQELCERHALKRLARPKEIASVIYFLASLDASFITGQDIIVDGGLSLDN